MIKLTWKAGIPALVVLVTLAYVAGSTLARRAMLGKVTQILRGETEQSVRSTVETLSHLRNGDYQKAIEHLEARLDAGLETLPRTTEWSALSVELRHAYMIGNAYRTAYPPDEPRADLERALEVIPFPDVKNCSPALQRALEWAALDQR